MVTLILAAITLQPSVANSSIQSDQSFQSVSSCFKDYLKVPNKGLEKAMYFIVFRALINQVVNLLLETIKDAYDFSIKIAPGSYFLEGGNQAFCKKKVVGTDGVMSIYKINAPKICGVGKICCDGNCLDSSDCTGPYRECTDNDPIGTKCGGGIKAAKGLVSAPGGCTDSIAPICDGSGDTLLKDWAPINLATYASSIDDGKVNTDLLIKLFGTNAAMYCAHMTLNGYDDWFLPSKEQLNKLYINRDLIGGFAIGGASYWSSTESLPGIWEQAFVDGGQDIISGDGYNYIRCVRSY